MADKAYCPICDSYTSDLLRSLENEGVCPYCGATEELIRIIKDAEEVLYDGVGDGVRVEDSPLIKLAIRQFKENQKLMEDNYKLTQSLRKIRSAMQSFEEVLNP